MNSFGGEIVSPETIDDPQKFEAFDLMAFIERSSKENAGQRSSGVPKRSSV
jgi:hypothetical protein